MAGNARRKRFGYSLIELVVSTFVVSLLLISVALALIYCNQYMRTCETKAVAQEEALTAAVYLSRYLQDANVTTMIATRAPLPGTSGISFESVRDPDTAQVDWSTAASGGTVQWPQNVVVYLVADPQDPLNNSTLYSKSIPNPGPPYPLDPPTPLDVATGLGTAGRTKVLARNIRTLQIEIYGMSTAPPLSQTLPPDLAPGPSKSINTVNITIEAFAPYYSLNYGVNVTTSVRPQN